MVRMVPDRTGRFPERPHYRPQELDRGCEGIITNFLRDLHGKVEFPVLTDDLTKLIERDAADLDLYADLSCIGPEVEGVTEFRHGDRPTVRVADYLASDPRRENRLRTTLAHEYGHVHYHAYLWELHPPGPDLLRPGGCSEPSHCKRETMLNAPQTDWMEWQAGYVCGALLMPASYIKQLVGAYQERHGLFGPVAADGQHGQALIAQVVERFRVSEDAARVRLSVLDYLGVERGPSLFG